METVFMACLVFGILFTLVSVVFGDWLSQALDGLFDFLSFEGGDWFNPTVLVGGITAFGGGGLLLSRYTDMAAAAIILVAVAIAVVCGFAVFFLYVRPMQQSENSIGYSIQDLSGKIGEVLVPIPAAGYGEVLVRIGAGVTNQIAASHDGNPIPEGARIVVIEIKEGALHVSQLDL